LLTEPSYLIYQRRHTGDIEFAVLTCQYIRANLNYYSFFSFLYPLYQCYIFDVID
jgi:hypothetical protein